MESTQSFMAFTPVIGFAGLVLRCSHIMWLLKQPAGNAKMTGIAGLIESGSMTFLRKEYTILVGFLALITGLLAWKLGGDTAMSYLSWSYWFYALWFLRNEGSNKS